MCRVRITRLTTQVDGVVRVRIPRGDVHEMQCGEWVFLCGVTSPQEPQGAKGTSGALFLVFEEEMDV